MIRIILVLVGFVTSTYCGDNQHFVVCSKNSYFNTSSIGKVLDSVFSVETLLVASKIACARICNLETDCIGINTGKDSLNSQQITCDLIFVVDHVNSITFLDPCSLIEEHEVKAFFVKETYGNYDENWRRIFKSAGTGNVVYGDQAAVISKIQNGESIRVLLKNFKDGNDFLVSLNTVRVYLATACAQSVHNFGSDNGDVFRSVMHICISGRIEIQVWRLWSNEKILEYVSDDVTAVWFADGRPRTEVIGLIGFGNVSLLQSGINNGQDVSTNQKLSDGFAGRIINSIFVNSSFIALKYPWEYAISASNGDITIRSNLYWFSLVFSAQHDTFISRWYIESANFISNSNVNDPISYMLDTDWIKIYADQLGIYLDQGKQLRAVFENRAETINLVRRHVLSGTLSFGVDRILKTSDNAYIDSTITQLYTVLTSTGTKAEYTVQAGECTMVNASSTQISIDWAVDSLAWTAVQMTSSTRDSNVTITVLSAAFECGKRFRVNIVLELYEYLFSADNVMRTGDAFMASYYGCGLNNGTDDGNASLIRVWSNGTVIRTQHLIPSGTVDFIYDDVDMWWFIN